MVVLSQDSVSTVTIILTFYQKVRSRIYEPYLHTHCIPVLFQSNAYKVWTGVEKCKYFITEILTRKDNNVNFVF